MNIRIILARLLVVFALASFMTSPFAAPAWAESTAPSDTPMATSMDASTPIMASMSVMECCPKPQQSPPDTHKDCPCAAVCAATCLSPLFMAAEYEAVILRDSTVIALIDDRQRDRAMDPPPPRPPRT